MIDELSRRDRKKLRAKKIISDIALEMFTTKGFSETTVAEIMNEADFAVGTFYNYFESKEDILKYSLSEKVNSALQTFEDIKVSQTNSITKLSSLLLAIGKTYEDNRKLLTMYLHYYRTNKHTHRHPPHMNEFQEIVTSIIKEGQDRGEFRTDIPLQIIVEFFKGILKTSMVSKSEIPFLENLDYKLKVFLDGITNNKGVE